ncbi:carbon-monoxide dehydrogenase large subunit [Rhodoligotrophos appendicifer]|uniref:xanthine dehydrogenase family protein molybdopterin-binding subunit n=1 Tax=Rhodoligotrophos appendicifer TaxID=987056 RepID=UPI001185529F|nr:xanthine dehydrogenase family protein molybdopterin-binding subunit [Rhodoligotrophos appendicifer]
MNRPLAYDRPLITPAEDPRSIGRLEDERFVTGHGRYVDDVPADGHLFAAFLRSPHAHAEIVSIDVAQALAMPGIRAVFTGDDLLADGLGPLPCSVVLQPPTPLTVPDRHTLAKGRVRHVGEPVAMILADSRAAAQDALETVEVDYESLPAIVDLRRARSPDAPQIWSEAALNTAYCYRRGDHEKTEAAFAEAAHVVELDLVNNRVAAAAMEPRTAIGYWIEAEQRYELHFSGSFVHLIRRELADGVFHVPHDRLDLVTPDVGGGFGMKNVNYPEYAAVLWAARRMGQPVRWAAERMEEFLGGVHGRDNLTRARLALDAEGNFTGLWVETTANLGAYVSSGGPGSSTMASASAMGGLYAIPAIAMEVHGVFTNTTPVDAYRGAGKPEANYIIERIIDVAAHRLGLDRIELRRRNVMRDFPYRNGTGLTVDSGAFAETIDRGLLHADLDGLAARRAEAQARGKLYGAGIGCFMETSRGQPNEEAWLRFLEDDRIELIVGTQSNGQGHETSFVQLVAARLGMPLGAFHFIQGDTRRIATGGAHGGARSLHMGSAALLLAIDDLLAKAKPAAARLLQALPEEVSFSAATGTFLCTGDPAPQPRAIGLAEVARHLRQSPDEAPLHGHGMNICDLFNYPGGCHVAEVEIDPETGSVTLARYAAVDDYGTLINPLLAENQVQGGIVQGIGQALMEESVYDPDTGQLISASFTDYAMPRGEDIPSLDLRFIEAPTKANPIGVKGSGQAGAIASPQAVINAVVDALRLFGIEHIDMPATPHRIWQALQQARPSGATP